MANTHQDPHNNPQQPQQVEDPHNPGFDLQGNPMQKPDNHDDQQQKPKNNWVMYLLYGLLFLLILWAAYLVLSRNNTDQEEETTPAIEQPIVNEPTQPAPIDSTDIKRAEEAEARAEEAEAKQAELAKQVEHLDSLAKGLIPNPNLQQPAQPGNGGITQPGNDPNAGKTAKGGAANGTPVLPGFQVVETCLVARPPMNTNIVYWCRETGHYQSRHSQNLKNLPGKVWPK